MAVYGSRRQRITIAMDCRPLESQPTAPDLVKHDDLDKVKGPSSYSSLLNADCLNSSARNSPHKGVLLIQIACF